MDYRDKVFLRVAENLSFSKAADDLFISQPAVTKHVKELENKLGIALFERVGNKIKLTTAGNLCYNHLKEIREQYENLKFQIGKLNDRFRGRLIIGASSTIAQYIIPPAIGAFYKKYPGIEICLMNGNSREMEEKLLEKKIDIALVENFSKQTNIHYEDFLEDEIVVVTSPHSLYGKLSSISAIDLETLPMVLREKGSGTLEVINNLLGLASVKIHQLNVVMHLGSTESIKNFLSNFDGVALVSKRSVERELIDNRLKILPIKNIHVKRQLRIAQRQGPLSETASLFYDFLRKHNF